MKDIKINDIKINDIKSLAQTTQNCKYHIVFAPKYRKNVKTKKIQLINRK